MTSFIKPKPPAFRWNAGGFFIFFCYFRARYRKVTIWPRVQVSLGEKVVGEVPMVTPLATAQPTASAIRALAAHVRTTGAETTGPFRSVYLEGPPSRGSNSQDYITQIAVPIRP